MSERNCAWCGKVGLGLPHYRVWEEGRGISYMVCFDTVKCMRAYYKKKDSSEVSDSDEKETKHERKE